jgi:hypothetical protein
MGVLLFMTYKVGFVSLSTAMLSQPVEVDDSYVYTWKSVAMGNCFRNDCTAANDLRKQVFTQTDDHKTESIRRRTTGEVFLVYTPLHSMAVLLMYKMGWDWITAYRIVVVVGVIFICSSLIYWTYFVWGQMATGISFIYTAPMMFQGQGLETIVPSNLCLGIGALMWGRIGQAGRHTWLVLPVGSMAAVMMHPIGKAYSALALGIYVLVVGRQRSWKNVTSFLLTLGILGVAFFVPLFVERPLMDISKTAMFQDYNWLAGVKSNVKAAFGSLGGSDFFKNLIVVGIGLTGFLLALTAVADRRKRCISVMGCLLGLLTLASLFYITPRHPGEVFHRFWIASVVFFSAACAHVLIVSLKLFFRPDGKTINTPFDNIPRNKIMSLGLNGWQRRVIIIIGVVMLGGIVWQLSFGTRHFVKRLEIRTKRHPFVLDREQSNELLKYASSEDKVLYTDEIPLLFHLVNGAHQLGAVYYPAIKNSPIESDWMQRIDYIAGWNNPFRQIAREGERYPPVLRLADITSITCESTIPEQIRRLEVKILNPGQAFEIDIALRSTEGGGHSDSSLKFDVPAEYEGWLSPAPKLDGQLIDWLQISPIEANKGATLIGFRFSDRTRSTLWPWRQSAKLTVAYKDNKKASARFDVLNTLGSKELRSCFEKDSESLSVMMDTGSLVLLRRINS